MRISTRGEYGLRALVELGLSDAGHLSLRDIADRQHMPLDYLEQIMPLLRSADLVHARRGSGGGYRLARDASQISVYDAFLALEGPLGSARCLKEDCPGEEACPARDRCVVREVWLELQQAVRQALQGLTLQQLVDRQRSHFGGPLRFSG